MAKQVAEYRVAHLDEIEQVDYRGSKLVRVRHELGIEAFGINSWIAEKPGDQLVPEHTEDQEDDNDELYVVVRGRARFEVGHDTFDAPEGTLVLVPAGPNRRTAHAEEAGTIVLAIGATPGKPFEADGWLELWGPVHDLYQAGDYEGVIAKGRETIEANPQYGGPLYNLACCESLAGHPEEAIGHLGMAIEAAPRFRDMARDDSDFDAIRDEPGFRELVD
jgi:mannose-6-phosphate isomerase-like protein (cupin superfamily)